MHVRSHARQRLSSLNLADGGFVENLKRRIFGRPASAPQPSAEQPARAASSAGDAQPPSKPSARARLGGLNMEALRRREEEAGLKDGGVVPRTGRIRGPGTGTSDSIPARMPVGSFVLPADSTEELAKVAVSDGETALAPEVVQRIGAAALLAMRDGTHTPAAKSGARTAGRQRLADGDPVKPEDQPQAAAAAAPATDSGGAVFGMYPQLAGTQQTSHAMDDRLRTGVQADGPSSFSPASAATDPGPQRMDSQTDPRSSVYGQEPQSGGAAGAPAPEWTDARQEAQAGRNIPWGSTDPAKPGEPPAAAPASYDLANGKDVGFGVRRFDGGSSPLFTNVPDAANSAALMGRGQVSPQNMAAADGLQSRENERFRGVQAVDQFNREVAEAKAINARPVTSTGESVGIRRDPKFVYQAAAANSASNRMRGVDPQSQERALRTNEINSRIESALNSEQGRNTRAQMENSLQRDRLNFERETAAPDARTKLNMAGAQDAILNAKTPEARAAAMRNLQALSGREPQKVSYTAVKGEKRPDGSSDPDMVVGSDGNWLQRPKPPQAAPAVGTVSTVNGRSAVWNGKTWTPR